MAKVSFIVPVFNVESFIRACLDSIINQTYRDWECILVDDGSTDNSGLICDDYAKLDSRFRTIHITNGGVSRARNLGLNEAKGEWVLFIDADDMILPNTVEYCIPMMPFYDIIRFSMIRLYPDYQDVIQIKEYSSKYEYISDLVGRKTILGVCGGIIKRMLFTANKICFDKYISNGEDWLVMAQLVCASNNIKCINIPFYQYNLTNQESCTHNYSLKKELDKGAAWSKIKTIVAKLGVSQDILNAKCILLLQGLSSCLINENKIISSIRNQEYDLIKEAYGGVLIKEIISSNLTLKEKIKLFLSSFYLGRVVFKLIVKNGQN